jgi:carbamoyltransferase
MKFIGIHDGHNASACVLENGEIKFAIQEERFTYEKNQGGLPFSSINYIKDEFSIQKDDVIGFVTKYLPTHDWTKRTVLNTYNKSDSSTNILRHHLKNYKFIYQLYSLKSNKPRLRKISNLFPENKVIFIEHHLCHAATAYYGLGNFDEDILVITADGDGDQKAGTVYLGKNGELKELLSLPTKNSIGWLYSYSTFLFNMVPFEHEYKIMGLAPYCKDRDRIEKCKSDLYGILTFLNQENIFWNYVGNYPSIQSAGKEIKAVFNKYRFDIYSAALQEFTEELLVKMISRAIRKFGINSIALAGGIFMNVKANMLIANLPEVHKCFVYPSCGDETNIIGLTNYLYFCQSKMKPRPLNNFYFGDEFVVLESELKKLDTSKVEIKYYDDIESEIAKLIASGEIVGRVKGRMEFGARALGNRSILANPSVDDVLKTINDMIKNRDFWMPFAPSVIVENIDDYFFTNDSVIDYEYMIFTCESKPEKRKYARNSLHPYDFTGRPQVVKKEHNPDYHRLITRYKELTGEGLILNTSYNLHGYPIVRTQEQALHVFLDSGLKFLALDNYMLVKKNANR